MVADKVTVLSRPAGDPDQGVRWESDGQGDFTVETAHKDRRGTDVILHLKPEEKEFLEPYTVRQIVKKFSNFIEHPVVMDVEKEDKGGKKTVAEETLNSRKALWLRSKSEATPEEYAEFYKQIANDVEGPARVIHYTAEGAHEFRVLAFIPSHRPMELMWGDYKAGLRLYVQRVLIMEHCEELLPPYLRFVRGVVDSSDLPLNISREMLQHNPLLDQIRNNVVRTVLKELDDMKTHDYEKYVGFYKELGAILKEGVGRDWNNRDRIADLLLFESLKTPADQLTTLEKYVESMPAEQKDITYLIGDGREQVEHSPHLEAFRAKGWDVLLLTDPIDEFVIPSLPEYKGKKLRAADRGEIEGDKKEKKKAKEDEKFKELLRASQNEAVGGERGAAVVATHGERGLPRGRRGRDVGPPGTADAADGPRRRGGRVAPHPGVERRTPRRPGAARPVREERRGPARRNLRPAPLRRGRDRGGIEGQRPRGVRPADQRTAGQGRPVLKSRVCTGSRRRLPRSRAEAPAEAEMRERRNVRNVKDLGDIRRKRTNGAGNAI